jgi:hypothetical protein
MLDLITLILLIAPAPVKAADAIQPDPTRQVYVEYSIESSELPAEVAGNILRVWRAGTRFARVETVSDSGEARGPITIVAEPDIYMLDPVMQQGQLQKDPDPAGKVHIPVLAISRSGKIAELEIGQEIEYFKMHHAVRGEDESVDGIDCAVFHLNADDNDVTLKIDLDKKTPYLLTVTEGGKQFTVHYLKYDRKQPFDQALFSPSKNFRVMGVEVAKKKRVTPFEGSGKGAVQFEVSDVKDGSRFKNRDCDRRPVLLMYFDAVPRFGELAMDQIPKIYHRYKDSQLCFFPLPRDPDAFLAMLKTKVSFDAPIYRLVSRDGVTERDRLDQLWSATRGRGELYDRRGVQNMFDLSQGGIESVISIIDRVVYDGSPESKVMATGPRGQKATASSDSGDSPAVVETKRLLEHGEFEVLDRRLAAARRDKARDIDGAWILKVDYDALAQHDNTEAAVLDKVAIFRRWARARPDSITPRVLLGRVLMDYAWLGRGAAYANQTSPQQFATFIQRLRVARRELELAERLKEKCPELYVRFIKLSMGQGLPREQAYAYFRRGQSLEPQYPYLYGMMANYLLPKWGGEQGEFERFVERIVSDDPGGIGRELAARTAHFLMDQFSENGAAFFRESDLSWSIVRDGERDIIKRYPDSNLDRNLFAFFACAAGDKKTARDLFDQIGDDFSVKVWGNRVVYEHSRRWAGSDGRAP